MSALKKERSNVGILYSFSKTARFLFAWNKEKKQFINLQLPSVKGISNIYDLVKNKNNN